MFPVRASSRPSIRLYAGSHAQLCHGCRTLPASLFSTLSFIRTASHYTDISQTRFTGMAAPFSKKESSLTSIISKKLCLDTKRTTERLGRAHLPRETALGCKVKMSPWLQLSPRLSCLEPLSLSLAACSSCFARFPTWSSVISSRGLRISALPWESNFLTNVQYPVMTEIERLVRVGGLLPSSTAASFLSIQTSPFPPVF